MGVCIAQTSTTYFLTMKTIIFDLDGTLVDLSPKLTCIADLKELEELRRKYNFALVSGGNRVEVISALAQTGLAPLFNDDLIVSREDTDGDKVSGEPFREILRRLKDQVVMVGDSDADEIGTKTENIPFVRVKTASTLVEKRNNLKVAIQQALQKI